MKNVHNGRRKVSHNIRSMLTCYIYTIKVSEYKDNGIVDCIFNDRNQGSKQVRGKKAFGGKRKELSRKERRERVEEDRRQ